MNWRHSEWTAGAVAGRSTERAPSHHVFDLCMCMLCVCLSVRTCVYVYSGQRLTSDVFPDRSLFVEARSLPEPGAHQLVQLVHLSWGCPVSASPPPSARITGGLPGLPGLLRGFWGIQTLVFSTPSHLPALVPAIFQTSLQFYIFYNVPIQCTDMTF